MGKTMDISAARKAALLEEYNDYFEDVQAVYPNFDENDKVRLGTLLENIEDAFDSRFKSTINEDVTLTAPNVIQGLKTQYMDIVTAVFPNLIADQIFSVQPLQHKVGEIFYLRFIYGSDFMVNGKNIKGQTIFGANEIAGYENNGYTYDSHEAEALAFTADAVTGGVSASLDYAPVCFETVQLDINDGTNDYTVVDDGKGNLITKDVTTGKDFICGNVDYSSGNVVISAGIFAGATVTGTANYNTTFEDANNEADGALNANENRIPSIELTVDSIYVQAKPRKLRANFTFDAGYDLQQAQGIDIKEALMQAAAMELKNEVDGELILTAYQKAFRSTSWSMLQPDVDPHISRKEYYELFIEHIFQQCSQIRQDTKRVTGNFIVCGKKAADILQFIGAPRFVGQNTTTEVGPYFAGTLDGRIKVYIDPFLGVDQYLIGYKGNQLIDAGLVYAPYLLFFATETVMLDDFIGRRGFSTIYAKKMVNNKMYIAGRIL